MRHALKEINDHKKWFVFLFFLFFFSARWPEHRNCSYDYPFGGWYTLLSHCVPKFLPYKKPVVLFVCMDFIRTGNVLVSKLIHILNCSTEKSFTIKSVSVNMECQNMF